MTTPDPTETIDLEAVVAAVHERGVYARVEHTGGGEATLYAGENKRIVGGPGWFDEPMYSKPHASTTTFALTATIDGVWASNQPATTDPERIADLIEAAARGVRRELRQQLGEQDLGLDR